MTQPIALLLSLIIEVPAVLLFSCITEPMSRKEQLLLIMLACAATMLTHPFAWESDAMLVPYLTFPLRVTIIESAVIVIEGTLYALLSDLGWRRGMVASALANAGSFFLGLVIYNLF